MNARTEIFLYQCLWIAEMMMQPTWRNLNGSFEQWCYRNHMLRQLHRLEAKGWLETRAGKRGTGRVVRLTQKGVLRALGGCDPQQRWNRKWDGRWRMVVFDLPEENRALRNTLRKQLRGARFGGLQQSVWISPDPLDEATAALKRTAASCGVMTFFEGSPCGGESPAQVVDAAWDFAVVNQAYTKYLAHLKTIPRPGKADSRDDLLAWWQKERQLWQTCMNVDPLLPKELCPKGYLGHQAWDKKRAAMRTAAKLTTAEPDKF